MTLLVLERAIFLFRTYSAQKRNFFFLFILVWLAKVFPLSVCMSIHSFAEFVCILILLFFDGRLIRKSV